MPGELLTSLGASLSVAETDPEPVLTLGELQDRLASPAMPAFTAAELLDGGISLIHDGPVDDPSSAFKAVAAKAELSAEFLDLPGLVGGAGGSDSLAAYMINAKYVAMGGAAGLLGPTTTAVAATPGASGWYRQYQQGRIYFTFASGAHEVHGAILDKWIALGAEAGPVGFPVTDQQTGDDPAGRGTRQRFEGASILSFPDWRAVQVVASIGTATIAAPALAAAAAATPEGPRAIRAEDPAVAAAVAKPRASAGARAAASSAGVTAARSSGLDPAFTVVAAGGLGGAALGRATEATHEVHGAIRARYDSLGAESSFLGYPTTDETGCPDGVGRYNHFEAGSIYWSPSTGAHEVHGLIRDLWAGQGWERGPLGYPLTDELIPDRRIGHVHPERRRKPVPDVPFDLVKLPEAAATLGFAATVVNTSPESMASRRIMAFENTQTLAAIGRPESVAVSPNATAADPSTASILGAERLAAGASTTMPIAELETAIGSERFGSLVRQAASTPAADRSTNRFEDFENGVAFWRRGEGAASVLTPWPHAADGTATHFVASDVVGAVMPTLASVFASVPNAQLGSITFVGTTGYSFDGAGVRNRRHRIRIELTRQGFGFLLGSATAIFEVDVEVAFEPESREVVALLADWLVGPQTGDFQVDLGRLVHVRLDDLLGTAAVMATINDTDESEPIAILSVKTMANGDVSIYVEPPNPITHWAVLNEVKVGDVLRSAAIQTPTP